MVEDPGEDDRDGDAGDHRGQIEHSAEDAGERSVWFSSNAIPRATTMPSGTLRRVYVIVTRNDL